MIFGRRTPIGCAFKKPASHWLKCRSLRPGRRKKEGVSPLVEDEAAGEDMSNILVYNRSVVAIMTVCKRYKYKACMYWLTMHGPNETLAGLPFFYKMIIAMAGIRKFTRKQNSERVGHIC